MLVYHGDVALRYAVVQTGFEQDVSTPSGHVRGYRHGSRPPRARHDALLVVEAVRVEPVVGDGVLGEQGADLARLLHRGGADEHRAPHPAAGCDLLYQ